MLLEQLPLVCKRCRQVTVVSVSEAQEHNFIPCAHCAAQIAIDKEVASCKLAELELRASTRKESRLMADPFSFGTARHRCAKRNSRGAADPDRARDARRRVGRRRNPRLPGRPESLFMAVARAPRRPGRR